MLGEHYRLFFVMNIFNLYNFIYKVYDIATAMHAWKFDILRRGVLSTALP